MSIYAPYGVLAKVHYRFLLDEVTGAHFAYALKKLRAAYAGNVIEVRRSSDNTTQNIGFSGNLLDTASLLSFVGAGDGFIRTWYDQSGNGYNATQTTAANQPKIVSSGAYLSELQFDGSNDHLELADAGAKAVFQNVTNGAVFVTTKSNSTTSIYNILTITTGASTISARVSLDFNLLSNNRLTLTGRRTDAAGASQHTSSANHGNAEEVISTLCDWGNSDALVYENGVQTVNSTSFTTDGSTSNTASQRMFIGANALLGTPRHLNGSIKNLIAYNTDKSGSRATAEAILNLLR